MTQSVGVPLTANSALADLAQPERIAERERMGDAGLVVFGRDDGDVVGEFARDRFQKLQPRRVDAVIVGEQDLHDWPFARGLRRGERVLARMDDSRDGQRLASMRVSPPM